jgi:putative ABC transport system permease protein
MMVKNPGFTAVGVLTLMLGIGACMAVFNVIHAVMPRALPYRGQDRLYALWKSVPKKGLEGATRRILQAATVSKILRRIQPLVSQNPLIS